MVAAVVFTVSIDWRFNSKVLSTVVVVDSDFMLNRGTEYAMLMNLFDFLVFGARIPLRCFPVTPPCRAVSAIL